MKTHNSKISIELLKSYLCLSLFLSISVFLALVTYISTHIYNIPDSEKKNNKKYCDEYNIVKLVKVTPKSLLLILFLCMCMYMYITYESPSSHSVRILFSIYITTIFTSSDMIRTNCARLTNGLGWNWGEKVSFSVCGAHNTYDRVSLIICDGYEGNIQ